MGAFLNLPDYRRVKAADSDEAYLGAISQLGLDKNDTVVVFVRDKGEKSWSAASSGRRDMTCYDLATTDVITVSNRHNDFGSWLEIEDHSWGGPVNNGSLHVGVGFINGELYQLDDSALFYGEDFEPYWSPVVHADSPELSTILSTLSGQTYPVMMCDGTDQMAWDFLIKRKEQAGFLYNAKEESFSHASVFTFSDDFHRHLYFTLARKTKTDTPYTLSETLKPIILRHHPELSNVMRSEQFKNDVIESLSLVHIKPDSDVAILAHQRIKTHVELELSRLQSQQQKQNDPNQPTLNFYHGGKTWLGKFELNAKKNGGMEHGPGLYLTNGIETAQFYAKGGGVVQRISIRADAKPLEGATCSADSMKNFLKKNSIRHYKKIMSDIDANAERKGTNHLELELLLNLMINYDSIKPSIAQPLSEFMVDNGADMSVFQAPYGCSYGGKNDEWVVIFNPDVVVSKTKVDMKHFDWSETHLPTYQKQLEAISLTQKSELSNSAPARRKI